MKIVLVVSLLIGLATYQSCSLDDDSHLKTIEKIEFKYDFKKVDGKEISLESCIDSNGDPKISCLDAIKEMSSQETKLMTLAVGTSYSDVALDHIETEIQDKIAKVRSLTFTERVDNSDFFIGYDRASAEDDLEEDLITIISAWEDYTKKRDQISNDLRKPSNLTSAQWFLLNTNCIKNSGDKNIDRFIYSACKEQKFLNALAQLSEEKRIHGIVLKKHFPNMTQLRSYLSDQKVQLDSIIDTRQSHLNNYLFKTRLRLTALREGTLLNTNINTTPWIATQTTEDFWRSLIAKTGERLVRKSTKIEEVNSKIKSALKSMSDVNIAELQNLLQRSSNDVQVDVYTQNIKDLTDEKNRKQKLFDDKQKEMKANGDRLIRDANLIYPKADGEFKVTQDMIYTINNYSDLAHKDCSKVECSEKNSKIIALDDGVSHITTSVVGSPRIVANGIYATLNDYMIGFDKLNFYYNCLTRSFENLPARNRKEWKQFCNANLSDLGMNPDEIMPFSQTKMEYLEDGSYVRVPDAQAIIMVPNVDFQTMNPSIPGLGFNLRKDDELTTKYQQIVSPTQRQKFLVDTLKPIYEKENSHREKLEKDLSQLWKHRINSETDLDGYHISISKGESFGTSESHSSSSGFSAGGGYGIPELGPSASMGYSQSKSSSSSESHGTSTGSNYTMGYFHNRTPAPNSVVGKLMGECLDAKMKPFSPPYFVELGKSSSFSKPQNCSNLILFINDDPQGVDQDDINQDGRESLCTVDSDSSLEGMTASYGGQLFGLNEKRHYINNDIKVGCTYLDKPFTIQAVLRQSAIAQTDKGIKLVSEENLRNLFKGEDGEIYIAVNSNAESSVDNKVTEYLDQNGVTLDSKVRSIIKRYVDTWLANEKMKYEIDQLRTDIALLSTKISKLTQTKKKIESQKLIIDGIGENIDTNESLIHMKYAFLNKLVAIHIESQRQDFIDLSSYLSLYLDALAYHNPVSAKQRLSEIQSDFDLVKQLLKTRLLTDNNSNCSSDMLSFLDSKKITDEDLRASLCQIDNRDRNSEIEAMINTILDKFQVKQDSVVQIRDHIIKSKIEHCSQNIASADVGGWGEEVSALDQYLVKLEIESSRADGTVETIFNPYFDDQKACEAYVQNGDIGACLESLQKYRQNKKTRPLVDGYYRIDHVVDFSGTTCFTQNPLDNPYIAYATLEVDAGNPSSFTLNDYPRNIRIDHSNTVSFSRDEGGRKVTYSTFLDYVSYGNLATTVLGEGVDWTPAQKQRIDLTFSGKDEPCKNEGFSSVACFNHLQGIPVKNKQGTPFKSSALSYMRPNLTISLYIPKISESHEGEYVSQLAESYQRLVSKLTDLTLHVYVATESL